MTNHSKNQRFQKGHKRRFKAATKSPTIEFLWGNENGATLLIDGLVVDLGPVCRRPVCIPFNEPRRVEGGKVKL